MTVTAGIVKWDQTTKKNSDIMITFSVSTNHRITQIKHSKSTDKYMYIVHTMWCALGDSPLVLGMDVGPVL